MSKSILIVAGETSGDTHGAGLVKGLVEQIPDITIAGIGGNKMRDAGMELLYHIREMSMMGFVEVVRHLPFIRRVMNDLMNWVEEHRPDAVILIDYPGFNLRFARKVGQYDIPVYYYISPQVWAWGKKRLPKMKQLIHKMFVIFPFEEEIYANHQIPVEFVGHPLVEEIRSVRDREVFYRQSGFDPARPAIGLLPGSRQQEIDRHLEVLLKSVDRLNQETEVPLQFWLAVAPDLDAREISARLATDQVQLVQNQTYEVMKHSTVVVVSSGSATLETAYFATPMVIIYKMNSLTWWLGKLLVDMEYIGLANIVAGQKVVPELLQDQANPINIASEVDRYLEDRDYYQSVRASLEQVREKLGEPGAGRRVATAICRELYE
ncbi:MAG: lipid-A-disaccharide synthase [Calditrichota bacterium]